MLELRAAGVPYRRIAEIVQRDKSVVERWLLINAGGIIHSHHCAYHGKDAVHRRLGVYFDISKQAAGDNKEENE